MLPCAAEAKMREHCLSGALGEGQGTLPCTAQLGARLSELPVGVYGLADRGTGPKQASFGSWCQHEDGSNPSYNMLVLMRLSPCGVESAGKPVNGAFQPQRA